jgi:hypothetical protein
MTMWEGYAVSPLEYFIVVKKEELNARDMEVRQKQAAFVSAHPTTAIEVKLQPTQRELKEVLLAIAVSSVKTPSETYGVIQVVAGPLVPGPLAPGPLATGPLATGPLTAWKFPLEMFLKMHKEQQWLVVSLVDSFWTALGFQHVERPQQPRIGSYGVMKWSRPSQ